MQSNRALLFVLSCILFGCSRTGPAGEKPIIQIEPISGYPDQNEGTARLFANSGISLISVPPNYRVTLVEEVERNKIYRTWYETTVSDGTAPIVIPISTPSTGGPFTVVVSHCSNASDKREGSKITIKPYCVVCVKYQCCPPQ